jgi:hypothetical protein
LVKQAAHDSLDECSNHFVLNLINKNKFVRVLEMVDRIILSIIDENHERSNRFSDKNLL